MMGERINMEAKASSIASQLESVAQSFQETNLEEALQPQKSTVSGHQYVVITNRFEIKAEQNKTNAATFPEITKLVKDILSRQDVSLETRQRILNSYRVITVNFKNKSHYQKEWKEYPMILRFFDSLKKAQWTEAEEIIQKGVKDSDGNQWLGSYDKNKNFQGTITSPDGTRRKGIFKEGKLHSTGEIISKDNRILAQGVFQNNMIVEGYGSKVFTRHNKQENKIEEGIEERIEERIEEGIFVADHLTKGKKTYKDGRIEEGIFVDDHLTQGKKSFPGERFDEGTFNADGLLDGQGMRMDDKGWFSVGKFEKGEFTKTGFSNLKAKVKQRKHRSGIVSYGFFGSDNERLFHGKVSYPNGTSQIGTFKKEKNKFTLIEQEQEPLSFPSDSENFSL